MRRLSCFPLLALTAFLPGCGIIPDSPAVSSSLSPQENAASRARVFSHTESFDEAAITSAAVSMIGEGSALSSEQAELCWKAEAARAAVREACLLAWAPGKDSSPLLEGELLEHARESRSLAVALVRRGKLASRLSLSALLATLTPLGKDPAWLRGIAIEEWLQTGAPASLSEAQELWNALGVKPSELDPATAFYAYKIARKLGVGLEEELLGAYCDPTSGTFAQVRCWRFLSAIVDPATGMGLDKTARAFLPQRRENGWILFERGFPERAPLLRPYR